MPKDEDGCIFLPTPKLVEALNSAVIVQISCGKAHSIAIPNTASFYSWGAAASGQLGHSNIETFPFDEDGYPYHPIPKLCEGTRNIKFITSSCGDTHTLILSEKGEIYSFGGNSYGQLGIGESQETDVDLDGSPFVPVPRKITAADNNTFVKVACGDQHSLAVDSIGDLFSWGSNGYGQLGFEMKNKDYDVDTEKPSLVIQPILVKGMQGKSVISITAGEMHSMALTQKGYLYSFGCGTNGQLGYNVQQMKGMGTAYHTNTKTFHCSHDPKVALIQPYPTLVSSILPRKVLKICSGGSHNICIAEKLAISLNKAAYKAYISKDFTDYELIAEGKSYRVHKCIFMSRSNYFKKIADKGNKYEFQCDSLIAQSIINFLYLCDYRLIESLDYSQLLMLLKQAQELEIPFLCSICKARISKITKNLLVDTSETKGPKKKKKMPFDLSYLPIAIKQFSDKLTGIMSPQSSQAFAFLPNGTMMMLDKTQFDTLSSQSVIVDIVGENSIETSKTEIAFNIEQTNDLSHILQTGEYSDIKITVQKDVFNLHKMILAQRSMFFKCAFDGKFKEKTSSEMEIEELEASDFRLYLQLVYSDVIAIEPSSISCLMKMSDRFRSDMISKRIEQCAIQGMNKQNACKLLKYSHKYNYDMLKDCCLQIISDNWDDIIHTKEVEDLDKEELLNIMRAKQKGK